MKTFLAELERLNVPVVSTSPMTDVQDAAIYLGGAYDGVHISIGNGYYSVVREMENEALRFVDGAWLLDKELEQVMK